MEKSKAKNEERREEAKASNQPKVEASLDRFSALRNHRIRFDDAIDPNAERVLTVLKQDILFGRGKGFQDHSGNVRMRQIIDKYKEQYHSLKRSHKRTLVEAVYKEIVEEGARFLTKSNKSNDSFFVLVDGEVALQKVNNALRCKKAYNKNIAAEMERETSGMLIGSAPGNAVTTRALESASALRSAGSASQPSVGAAQPLANPLAGADSCQRARFNQYDFASVLPTMPTIPAAFPHTNIDYYNVLRQRQLLLRETLLLQQIQNASIISAAEVSGNVPLRSGGWNNSVGELRRASFGAASNEPEDAGCGKKTKKDKDC